MDEADARVYGSDPEDRGGLFAGHVYAALLDGPLDRDLLDVTGWSADELIEGDC